MRLFFLAYADQFGSDTEQ